MLIDFSPRFGSKALKTGTTELRRWRKYRHKFWVRAVMVGMLLTGAAHLFTAEVFHHHSEVARACQIEHLGGNYLHAGQDLNPLCPLCQIVRNTSVRPAVQSLIQKQDQEFAYQPLFRRRRYSSSLSSALLTRAPPLF